MAISVKTFISMAILTSTVSTFCLAAENQDPSSFSTNQKTAIELIIKDLLTREPEIIEAAIRTSIEKKENEAKVQATELIKKSHQTLFEDPSDPILGNPKGSVAIVAFMDPYCGYCRRFQSTLLEVIKERPEVKVIYKAYPILGPESKKAAEEELAANSQGKFIDFHEALYESSVKSRKERLNLAKANKINVDNLKKSIPGLSNSEAARKVEKQLANNLSLGEKLQIHGTPAFVIGDQLHSGAMDKESLLELLNEQKKKQS